MRLLNVHTLLLEEFNESKAPPYAILSHTWGEGEVTFDDIQDTSDKYTKKAGYEKIHSTCKQAISDKLEYVWIDTCCIDKSSSAELSESINSMFRWYEKAEICYAFLADVPEIPFRMSRWFTRGWTLQELLAPRKVAFFGADWSFIGTRAELNEKISEATGIDRMFLCNGEARDPHAFGHGDGKQHPSLSIHKASIAARMSWASSRETTRPEDMAYCLFGLFDVNMPLIYGEGQKAFLRLQEEIIKRYNDHSIFAWIIQNKLGSAKKHDDSVSRSGILALSPAAFSGCGSIISFPIGGHSSPFNVTNQGVQIRLPISNGDKCYALLECQHRNNPTTILALPVRQSRKCFYERVEENPISVDHRTWGRWPKKDIFLSLRPQFDLRDVLFPDYAIHLRDIPEAISIRHHPGQYRGQKNEISKTEIIFLSLWGGKFNLALCCRSIAFRSVLSPITIETCLIKVPDEVGHSMSERIEYILDMRHASSFVFLNNHILFTNLQLQTVGEKPLFILDIVLSSRRSHILWFSLKRIMLEPILPIHRAFENFTLFILKRFSYTFFSVSYIGTIVVSVLYYLYWDPELAALFLVPSTSLLLMPFVILSVGVQGKHRLPLLTVMRVANYPYLLATVCILFEKRLRTIICPLLFLLSLSYRYWNWRSTNPYREKISITTFLTEAAFNGFPIEVILCALFTVCYRSILSFYIVWFGKGELLDSP
ncbi:heterokaryon incompatibility protein-domain-containing protein [Aspergillus flavus]|uniref:Heterokaryon incompatibility protein-domain-containing protein n=1 Tax=Aspergillus flavus (strain ATCC 200026 / FGSC A1120 / IAM 13836 / NRRL 3357 / JCM 12722 / SRRC 167) TaxID=332952 RepID=A0A7U2MEH7_ASPFN|nr:heterokaryon incompatibility protein-domain-containing protein [Aspergillus flavus]